MIHPATRLASLRDLEVLVPVGGSLEYLPSCLESVLSQSGVRVRVIVVDDTKSREEGAELKDLIGQWKGVRLIDNDGEGVVDALNTGIRHIQSDLFSRMDADDIQLPGHLYRAVAAFRGDPSLAVCGSLVRYINAGGRLLPSVDWLEAGIPLDPRGIRSGLRSHNCIFNSTTVLRTEDVLRVGGYRKTFDRVEDYDLWLRMSAVGDIRNLARISVLYRIHLKQIGNMHGVEVSEQALALRRALAAGVVPGVSPLPALESKGFVAVLGGMDDDDNVRLRFLAHHQVGFTCEESVVVSWAADPQHAQYGPTHQTTWRTSSREHAVDGLLELSKLLERVPPDKPIVFFGPASKYDRTRVARQVNQLLATGSAWTAEYSGSLDGVHGPNGMLLEPQHERLLHSNLLAEARALRWRGVALDGVSPLVERLSFTSMPGGLNGSGTLLPVQVTPT